MFRRLLFVVTTGGTISGMDSVLLIGIDFMVLYSDPDTDPNCGIIGRISVMNSVVILRDSWLVQEEPTERVTKHPPGRTNFAIGMDNCVLSLFTLIVLSTTFSCPRSLTSFIIDWSSSGPARMKLANVVTMGVLGRALF